MLEESKQNAEASIWESRLNFWSAGNYDLYSVIFLELELVVKAFQGEFHETAYSPSSKLAAGQPQGSVDPLLTI